MFHESTVMIRQEATINEIRTERLSRALQAMNDKTSPILFPSNHEQKILKNRSLSRTHSSSTIDEVESMIRRRRSETIKSFSRRTQCQSFRVPSSNFKLAPPLLTIGCETLDRFVRYLMPQQEDDDCAIKNENHWKSIANHQNRSRAISISNRIQLNVRKSPSPTPRIRSGTEPGGGKKDSRNANLIQQYTSKSTSSTTSSRSLSPMMAFTGGMLSNISSDSQLSSPLSPGYGDLIVLVVGSKKAGKTTLINRFVQGTAKIIGGDFLADDNRISIIVNEEETQLRFIQVNNQESDLWLTLSCVAYLVLYHADDHCSFRNAIEVLARLKERNDTKTKPIMLVANKRATDRKRFAISNDDGRQIAKQNNCKFHEIYIDTGRTAFDLLIALVFEIRHTYFQDDRSETPRSIFDNTPAKLATGPRTPSANSSTSSVNSKNSSLTNLALNLKFWPKKKVKRTCTQTGDAVCAKVSLADGLQACLFGERRGSRSLDNLPLFVNH